MFGCSEGGAPPTPSSIEGTTEADSLPPRGAFTHEARLVETPIELRLGDDRDGVWLDREWGRLELGRTEQRRFSSGWLRVEADQTGRGGAPASIPATGRASIVEIPIADVVDRRLELDLAPLAGERALPNQVVRIVWNGVDLGRHELAFGRQIIGVEVPAAIQRPGLNRLRIEPLYWVSGQAAGVSGDGRPISFTLWGLTLVGGSDAPSSRPRGVAFVEDGVVQAAGAIFAWYARVPHGARLRGSLRWEGDLSDPTARVHAELADDSGERLALVDAVLADLSTAEGLALDVDLARFGGRLAGVHAAVSGKAGEGRLIWSGVRVEGVHRDRAVDADAVRDDYDVLVLLFDTLRADHLSPYGNDEVQTPHLEALAASGFTFMQAGSNASWTRPSVASLWTGLHPWAHGVTDNKASVPTGAPYLPAILSGAGWRTVGVASNPHFTEQFGFARGFDTLVDYWEERFEVLESEPSPEGQAARLWSRFVAPVFDETTAREGEKGQPVFALVHEIDPHSPYQAPEPYASLYDFGYQGNIDGWDYKKLRQSMRVLEVVNAPQPWLGEADRRALRAAYMAEVSFVDAYVGALFGHLEASGRRDRTLVVFLSDHGEQLFEHGAWGHGRSLYQEELAVPLIFSLPGVIPAGQRSAVPVELVDVAPTILDLLGLERPSGMQGRSLLADMLAGPSREAVVAPQYAKSNVVLVERHGETPGSVVWDSLRLGRWKLLRATHRRLRVPRVEYELYDLERDPEEVLDLWGARPVVGHALRQMLEVKIARDERLELESEAVDEIDPSVLENLRGLGYVE